MVLKYDRRSPELLLQALEPGGFAHGLVQYGCSGMFGLDLQLRGKLASLYIGTTKAIDLHVTANGKYKLTTHETYAHADQLKWHRNWSNTQEAKWFQENWELVESYLDRVITEVSHNGRHLQEGVVQSAISRFPGNGIAMIDREAVVNYDDMAEKRISLASTSTPWLAAAAMRGEDKPRWWRGSVPTQPSTECDILGITSKGELATIEVKPSSAGPSSIAWSPLQARQYANQFQAWLNVDQQGHARVIREFMSQQQRIGIRPSGELPPLDPRLPVKAIVVIDARVQETGLARLNEVVRYLQEIGNDPQVEVVLSNLVGRLLPLSSRSET
jgi:hypothetical protein